MEFELELPFPVELKFRPPPKKNHIPAKLTLRIISKPGPILGVEVDFELELKFPPPRKKKNIFEFKIKLTSTNTSKLGPKTKTPLPPSQFFVLNDVELEVEHPSLLPNFLY